MPIDKVLDNVNNTTGVSEDKINEYLTQIREGNFQTTHVKCKISSSSEEAIYTSDEYDCFVGGAANPGGSNNLDYSMEPRKSTEDHAAEIICNEEKSKAQMYAVPGKSDENFDIAKIDQDYQMIDAHIDETLRKRIQNFEFIELGKLIQKGKGNLGYNRMEIVNRNGYTYLSPV